MRWWRFDPRFDRFRIDRARDLAAHPRCKLLLHATVRELVLQPDGVALERLDLATPDNRRIVVRARHYLLAAGGIENPRLLLASRSVVPDGIGNRHDQVGRYFMEHPHGRGGRIVAAADGRWLAAFAKRRVGGVPMSPAITASAELQRREGLLNSALSVAVRPPAGGSHPATRRAYLAVKHRTAPTRGGRTLWKATKRLVRGYKKLLGPVYPLAMKQLRGLDLALVLRAEQAPNPDSRVMLTGDCDAAGVPRVALDWRMSAIDVDSALALVRTVGRESARLGLGQVEPAAWLQDSPREWIHDELVSAHPIAGYHHIGTTRMAADPRHGVTDGWGRVHGVANLSIAGSSLFPTGGWANPTLTIVALALRTADRIARSLEPGSSSPSSR